jgi:uroporphyrinogen-III synthase
VENVPGAGDLAQTKIVACIGPVTANAAFEHGISVDVVADEFTVDGLILALEGAHAIH